MVSMTSPMAIAALALLATVALCGCDRNSSSLARRRRYLNFPSKANLVVTCSLLKGIANDVTWFPTTKVVTIHEIDVLFPLPHDPSPFELGQTALGQPPSFRPAASAARRHRRQLYSQLEDLFHTQGLDGRACILKAICEANNVLQVDEENILIELLTIIFRMPESKGGGEEYDMKPDDCDQFIKSCPVSLFDLTSKWAHIFHENNLPTSEQEQ